jgi:uncharacterized protein YfaS (alpha-2-macroglobulin family)
VREWFPETLLWRPELITDDSGRASIEVDLADSITDWRLTATAVSADGDLGATLSAIRVFQPFFVDLNLPVALTRGDEVAVPVVVYNYLDRPQMVELKLDDAAWFERLGDAVEQVELAASEVRSVSFRLRAAKVGEHELQVSARGEGVTDAIKRAIEVVPDGQRVETVFNGTLQQPAQLALEVPDDAIEGSAKAILKIYPSSFSQLVEGLDSIFQRPYGCFEQTSSTTYPNVLALEYLRRTSTSVPAVEAKARQYIQLGYQRLLGFEVPGGGFDWFGRPPANRTLTAYGLMEFADMARVFEVDPMLIDRTRKWLLAQRAADGTWSPEGHMLHEEPTRAHQSSEIGRLTTTAYVAWAVFDGKRNDPRAMPTWNYLVSLRPEAIDDPYVLALVANALLAMDSKSRDVRPYLDRLDSMKQSSGDGKLVWWQQPATSRTPFYGTGRCGNIETTALAALALISGGQHPATTRAALAWLANQKDSHGTWHSTQATVLALKALIAGTGKPLADDKPRRIEINWSGTKRELLIPADQSEVMKQLDLSDLIRPSHQSVTLTDCSGTAAGFQLTLRYHTPHSTPSEKREPLRIDLVYDRTELRVHDTVEAAATVVNNMAASAPMVILDLPIPAGFALEAADLDELVGSQLIAKYQITPRSAVVYLRGLEPGQPLVLRYRLRATTPVKITVPPAQAYEYYDPDRRGISSIVQLVVRPS